MILLTLGLITSLSVHGQSAQWLAHLPSSPAIKSAASGQDALRRVAELYAAGELDKAVILAQQHLTRNPSDHTVRAALAVVLFKAGHADRAEEELRRLSDAAASNPSIRVKLDAIDRLRSELRAQTQLAEELSSRLRAFDQSGARDAIERLKASAAGKVLLHTQIDIYAGDFKRAKQRLAAFEPAGEVEQRQHESMRREVERCAKEADALFELWADLLITPMQRTFDGRRIDDLLRKTDLSAAHQAMARGLFSERREEWSGEARLKIWARVVADMFAVMPLSPGTLQAAFSTAVALEDYEGMKALGDRILAATGKLEVKLVGAKELGSLVIDTGERTISVVVEEGLPADAEATKEHKALQPFTMKFEDVRSLKQEAKCGPIKVGGRNCFNVVALRLGPAASSGRPMLVQELAASFGELAARRAIRNLGRYVGDVVGLRPDQVKLLSEKASTGPGLIAAVITGGLAGLNAAAGHTATAASWVQSYQGMLADGRRTDATLAAEHNRWEAFAADRVVDTWREAAFVSVEESIGLVHRDRATAAKR